MQDLYTKNYKILLEELKKIWINETIPCVHGSEDNIVMMAILPKLIYIFNAILISAGIFFFFQKLTIWA